MPDVPKDPRQLARDILSGKIRIEDLAKQRQNRPGPPTPPPAPRTNAPVPLPRPVPPPVQPSVRPQRQIPTPPPQRSAIPPQRPVLKQAPPPKRPQAPPQRQQAPVRPAPSRPTVAAPPTLKMPARPEPPMAPSLMDDALKSSRDIARLPPVVSFRSGMRSKASIRNGILMAEILAKPLSLRDD